MISRVAVLSERVRKEDEGGGGVEGGRGDRGEGARKESEWGKRKAQDEEDDEEEEGGGGRGRDGEAAA